MTSGLDVPTCRNRSAVVSTLNSQLSAFSAEGGASSIGRYPPGSFRTLGRSSWGWAGKAVRPRGVRGDDTITGVQRQQWLGRSRRSVKWDITSARGSCLAIGIHRRGAPRSAQGQAPSVREESLLRVSLVLRAEGVFIESRALRSVCGECAVTARRSAPRGSPGPWDSTPIRPRSDRRA